MSQVAALSPQVNDNTVIEEQVLTIEENVAPVQTNSVKKRRTCRVTLSGQSCPYPETCPGRSNRKNCFLHTVENPANKGKRKVTETNTPKTGQVCGTKGCRGVSKRMFCPSHAAPI